MYSSKAFSLKCVTVLKSYRIFIEVLSYIVTFTVKVALLFFFPIAEIDQNKQTSLKPVQMIL